MRIAIASYGQETSSFSPVVTTLDTFRLYGLFEGDEILSKSRGIGSLGGFLAAMDEAMDAAGGWTPVPIVHGWAGASGPLTADTLDWFAERISAGLRAAGDIDAVYFALHGAAVAEQAHDTEGYLLDMARQVIGDDVPLVVSLDHHANLTQAIVEGCDAFVAHRTQPHDQADSGRLAAQLLLAIVRDGAKPVTAWRKIPLLTHQEQFLTAHGPMKVWFDLARQLEARAGVLSASTLPMQPWLDVPEGGWACAVVTDGDAELAEALAQELADHAWAHRDDYCKLDSIPPADAVRRAEQADGGLIVLTDTGDSIWGGATGDQTTILAEFVRQEVEHLSLITLVDPEFVAAAIAAGEGATITRQVGGKLDPRFGQPCQISGRVARIGGGRIDVSLLGFASYDLGPAVLMEVGQVRLVVCSERGIGGNHPSVYEHFGVDVGQARSVVVKTASNWQFYQPWLREVIRVDTPGATTSHLEDLPWTHLPRPIYPLDADTRM